MKRIYLADIHVTPGGASDLSPESVAQITDILDGRVLPFDELFLVGDTWEPEYFGYWSRLVESYPAHFLQQLVSVPKVIVAGNHDRYERLIEVIPSKVCRSYLTEDGVLCLHGDVFDRTIARFPKISAAVSQVGIWLENYVWQGADEAFDDLSGHLSGRGRYAQGSDYLPCLERLALWHRAPAVVWGHTHTGQLTVRESCLLANGGTWKGKDPATFIYQVDDVFELYQSTGTAIGVVSRGRKPA